VYTHLRKPSAIKKHQRIVSGVSMVKNASSRRLFAACIFFRWFRITNSKKTWRQAPNAYDEFRLE